MGLSVVAFDKTIYFFINTYKGFAYFFELTAYINAVLVELAVVNLVVHIVFEAFSCIVNIGDAGIGRVVEANAGDDGGENGCNKAADDGLADVDYFMFSHCNKD